MDNFKLPFSALKILSQAEAEDYVNREPKKWNVISLVSANGNILKQNNKIVPLDPPDLTQAKTSISLCFDDKSVKEYGYHLCQQSDIAKILEYVRNYYNDNLAVHCHMGVSRSSAITFLILLDYYKNKVENSIDESLKQLIRIKNWNLIHPNKYIINLGVEYIVRNSGLSEQTEIDWFRELYNHNIFKLLFGHNTSLFI